LQALEISPLKTKKLTVYLLEKEYNEPFWLVKPLENGTPHKSFSHLFRPSIAFCKFLEKLTQRIRPHFATEEQGMRTQKFLQDSVAARIFSEANIPFVPVDIDENARGYLAASIEEKIQFRDQLLEALEELPQTEGVKREYLIAYCQCLQREIDEEIRQASFTVRENWIAMGILDQAREIDGEDELTAIHLSSPEHVKSVAKLLRTLNVHVETLKLSKKVTSAPTKTSNSLKLEELLQSTKIVAQPVVSKTAEETPSILFYLDTDKRASPFDICMAYDAGFKAVVPYENVSKEDAQKIAQDAMFSRGPKGVKQTYFFVGGRDAEKAEEVLETIKRTMFPPFQAGIIIDPSGAYTTAAAAVAKVENELASHKLGKLRDKTCAVFGTGPVGRTSAVLLTRLGCEVTVISPNPNRKNGTEYMETVARMLRSKYGANVRGAFAPTARQKLQILREADVTLCASSEGVRVIDQGLLNKLNLLKVIADTNAVPPLGIEGIKLEDDMRELAPGIFGIGALAIGKLKYQLERELLKDVKRNAGKVYNYKTAFQLARRLVAKEDLTAKLTVTLKYPQP
jgi:methylene-tetrahydromethanopterin dehydrogenase